MTNNPRFLLWLALAPMLWLNYAAWNHDYGERTPPGAAQSANAPSKANAPAAPSSDLAAQVPQAEKGPASAPGPHPAPAPPPPASDSATGSAGTPIPAETTAGGGGVIHVRTDVLDL